MSFETLDSSTGQNRASVYSNDANEEGMSAFAKQIAQKRKAIKSPQRQSSVSKVEQHMQKSKAPVEMQETTAKEHITVSTFDAEEKKDASDHKKERTEHKRRAVCN